MTLPQLTQIQVHHIVREALANVRQHARAQHAWVRVDRAEGCARFSVVDDGCGFDPHAVPETNHLGLAIMRTRAQRQGGTLVVESTPGRGTRVVASFPVDGAADAGHLPGRRASVLHSDAEHRNERNRGG